MSQLKFIDISSHQSVEAAAMAGIDGVIVKTTEGTGYVNPKGDAQYQLAKKAGRLLGFYHYASGGNPVAEANYFYENSKNYFKEAVPFLDWESGSNASWGDVNWCRKFVDRIHELTGVWCGIYIQASSLAQVANLANTCPLWIAGYPVNAPNWNVPTFQYSTAPWETYTLWQFTGGDLDRNVVNVDAAGWKKIANPTSDSKPDVKPDTNPKPTGYSPGSKSLEQMATDTQNGLTGAGDARKTNLGGFYTGVQAIVNERAKTITGRQCHDILVAETKAGKYGDGDARKSRLGSYYNEIQNIINQGSGQTYIVKSGDTLSGIGAKLGVNWVSIADKNGIKAPYIITVGQTLKI